MDFQAKVGTTIQRHVSPFTRRMDEESILGFGVDFEDVDMLFFENRTAAEKNRDDRQTQSFLDSFDYWCHADSQRDRSYASMRIFHTNGQPPEPLIEGDLWELLVTKCYHNPNEPKTKDSRRKIHFSVRPLRRVETTTRECDFIDKEIRITRQCGFNEKIERIRCTIRRKKYHAKIPEDYVVEVEEAFVGNVPQGFFQIISVISIEKIMKERKKLLGRSFDPKAQGRFLRELTPAPEALSTQLA